MSRARRFAPPSTHFDKNALRRELARDEDEELRKSIAKLREDAKRAREERDAARAAALAACRQRMAERIVKADEAYVSALAKARTARMAKKAALREECQIEAAAKRAEGQAVVELRNKELAAERAHRDAKRLRKKHGRQRERERGRSAKERREESDQAVESNIEAQDPRLVAVWRRVRRSIKGSALKSRTEAFWEYIEENPDETAPASGPSDNDFAAEYAAYRRAA